MNTPENNTNEQSTPSGLTPEELTKLKVAQKRNMIFAALFGIVLAIFGFFAGQNLAQEKSEKSFSTSVGDPAIVWEVKEHVLEAQ